MRNSILTYSWMRFTITHRAGQVRSSKGKGYQCISSLPRLRHALRLKTVTTVFLAPIHANILVLQNESPECLNPLPLLIRPLTQSQDIFNDVSSSQPQQATSNYLALALYARASAAIFPAAHHFSPEILQVEVVVELPVENSRVQQHYHPSRDLRFACGAVVASTYGVSVLFRSGGL